jgi:L-fucose isomerase-like protein
VDIPFEMLTAELESLRQSGTQANQLRSLLDYAEFFREANEEDLRKSSEILQALRNLARKQHLDALTLRCFDLVLGDKSTGCLALSVLSDEGIPAGCEGDIPSIITMRWLQLLTGATGWMANPSRIDIGGGQDATMLIAHCTAPRSILAGYGLRSHFESGLGVAVAGVFDKGPVTLVRIGGALLDRLWYAEAQIMESPREEGLCRTQAVIRLPSEKAAELLSAPLGNHLVMIRGHWSRRIAAFASLARLHEKIV